jgi:PBP1b-binding outer membrane lipoprotein LpoB
MKNTILILATALFLFGCNDTDDVTDTHVDNTTHDVVQIDYSNMTFAEQEADMNERLMELRND